MLALSIPLIPVVLFGLGEAHWMIDDVRGRALLDSMRGQPAVGVDALGLWPAFGMRGSACRCH